jgi:hypothetical protein
LLVGFVASGFVALGWSTSILGLLDGL